MDEAAADDWARGLLGTLASASFLWALSFLVEAQQPRKIPRVVPRKILRIGFQVAVMIAIPYFEALRQGFGSTSSSS